MYFSGWMTDAHYSYWCYSISGLCDILVPPSITCSIWLSSHDNRTGALLLRCRCFLCVCSKCNDQLELCNNCRQHSISSHIHKMHAIKTKLLIMFYLPHVFYPPRPLLCEPLPPRDPTKTPNAFDSLFVSAARRLAVWKQTHIASCIPAHLFWIKTSPVVSQDSLVESKPNFQYDTLRYRLPGFSGVAAALCGQQVDIWECSCWSWAQVKAVD